MVDSNRQLETIREEPNLEINMADQRVDQIYKALRLLPEFDGNQHILTRFIHLADQLVLQYMSADPQFALSNAALINGILNKITGPASRHINSNGIPETWEGIRGALINNFADQRDESSLYTDLSVITQGNSTPQEFYEKCQNLFGTIITYISLHETDAGAIESKRSLYKKLTLKSYLRGLRDPLGSRVRCMRPDTIEKALEFTQEEMNTLYMQQRNDQLPEKKSQSTSSMHSSNPYKLSFSNPQPVMLPPPRAFNFPAPNNFSSPNNFSMPNNMPGPSRNFNFQPPRPMPVWRPQMPANRGPTRTMQMFSAPPPNYRQSDFRMPPANRGFQPPTGTGPKPMSGVSHFVSKPLNPTRVPHDWSRHGNPPPSNYFKTREINFNEYYDPQCYYEPNYDCYTYHDLPESYDYNTYDYNPTYELYNPNYLPDYLPATVEETTDETPTPDDNQGFSQDLKSEKPK